jgi:formate/nitrite transporter FocA (FNT family)
MSALQLILGWASISMGIGAITGFLSAWRPWMDLVWGAILAGALIGLGALTMLYGSGSSSSFSIASIATGVIGAVVFWPARSAGKQAYKNHF